MDDLNNCDLDRLKRIYENRLRWWAEQRGPLGDDLEAVPQREGVIDLAVVRAARRAAVVLRGSDEPPPDDAA